jgi:PAS domain S-box-containing protein
VGARATFRALSDRNSHRRTALPPPEAAARLFALSHDLMGAIDRDGRLVWTNPAWEEALGWTAEELAAMNYLELVHPDDVQRIRLAESELVTGAAAHWPDTELRVRHRDGRYRWILFSGVVSAEERLLFVSGKDVSARNDAVAALELLHTRYRTLVANLPDTIVILFDPDLRILVAEGAQLARRGLDADTFTGIQFADALPADQRDALLPRYRAALAGEPQVFDVDTPDGLVTYRVHAVPLHDDDGDVIGGMAVSRDVTDARRHERALSTRATELERSNAELAQFAYVASHDLSEPLRMISSYLQLLRRRYRGQIDEDADAFIDYAVEGAQRMRALIEDLLAYSRAGRSERPHEPVDTERLVADIVETLRAQDRAVHADIEWSGLPVVNGDAVQLTQLFQNLIGNGVKFVAAGVRPQVQVGAAREAELWRFTVDDNGVGIEPHQLERVFGMFQRLHTRDEFEGTGIGLAIAKKVVENHGGTIRALGLERGGTRFEFTLPCQDERS